MNTESKSVSKRCEDGIFLIYGNGFAGEACNLMQVLVLKQKD